MIAGSHQWEVLAGSHQWEVAHAGTHRWVVATHASWALQPGRHRLEVVAQGLRSEPVDIKVR